MEDSHIVSGENERGHSVPIQIMANSIREKLNSVSPLSEETCIYRVPKILRKVSESAYTPQLVSIGPFHHNSGSLGNMDVHKQRYLKTYLDWYPWIKLESYLEALWGLEARASQCYDEFINLNSYQFVEMMLLDGFFIIVFLLKSCYLPDRQGKDPIFDTLWMPSAIQVDMMLLENQLPFFILEHLFNLVSVSEQGNTYPDLFDLIIHSFGGLVEKNTIPETIDRSKVKHILDLLRSCSIPLSTVESRQELLRCCCVPFISPIAKSIRDRVRSCCIPFTSSQLAESPQVDRMSKLRYSVTELHDTGVKFKAGVSGSNCLLDLKFIDGVLEIQPLRIHDGTEPFFRNLIAFEQCHYPSSAYVTSYASFMDYLINTPKDVGLLIHHEIIENYLGDNEELSGFINNLSKDVVLVDESYFSRDYEELHAYCKMRQHKWMTSLRREYFNSPWAIISFFAAVLLLVLTLIQSICSIISL
ncbi:hypothetical protein HHK36_025751 [Tetracentron sinense]|uniref:Uncharacterized protein n=1 Tax=Tetracentron sinense TaxID=13715 RepID=A0A834YL32_TETSI|nr:hypothetical protein HHK36_025751 [Tetracentron sinense]